jgi:transcriptional regulator with XRE-family HTH domain
MNSDEIYLKVEALRKAKGMTIYVLSQEADISHSTFYSWQKRKTMPTLEVLEKIAGALGTTLAKLLFNLEANELSEEQKKLMEYYGNPMQARAVGARKGRGTRRLRRQGIRAHRG